MKRHKQSRTADKRRCSRFKVTGKVTLERECISKHINDLLKKWRICTLVVRNDSDSIKIKRHASNLHSFPPSDYLNEVP